MWGEKHRLSRGFSVNKSYQTRPQPVPVGDPLNQAVRQLLVAGLAGVALLSAPLATAQVVAEQTQVLAQQQGDVLRLQADAPQSYVVKRGDTLWDIAGIFLATPWRWPELWQNNDGVENPHLIYPGDILYLSWVDGRPVLTRKPSKKLSPSGQLVSKAEQPISTLSHALIAPFLDYHLLLDDAAIAQAPRVLGDNAAAPRFAGFAPVFVQGRELRAQQYGVFTRLPPLLADHEQHLLRHVADITLAPTGSPPTEAGALWEGQLARVQREVRPGDLVLPLQNARYPLNYAISQGLPALTGQIVNSTSGRQQLGRYDVVVLNQGQAQGMQVGQIYQAMRKGSEYLLGDGAPIALQNADKWANFVAGISDSIQLPDAASAELMVVAVTEQASFAIVLQSHDWLQVGDRFVAKVW